MSRQISNTANTVSLSGRTRNSTEEIGHRWHGWAPIKTNEAGDDFLCFGKDVHAAKNAKRFPCKRKTVAKGKGASRHTILWSRAILPPKSSICFTTDIPATRVPPRLRMTLKVVFGMQRIGPSNDAWLGCFLDENRRPAPEGFGWRLLNGFASITLVWCWLPRFSESSLRRSSRPLFRRVALFGWFPSVRLIEGGALRPGGPS